MRQTVDREAVFGLLARVRLQHDNVERLTQLLSDYDMSNISEENVTVALRQNYSGVSNGFLADLYEAICGVSVEVAGDPVPLFVCPCCGFRTLTELHDPEKGTGYDVCDHCGWEDDGTTDETVVSSVNHTSMAELRSKMRTESNYYERTKWLR